MPLHSFQAGARSSTSSLILPGDISNDALDVPSCQIECLLADNYHKIVADNYGQIICKD